ncbi:MAG: DUF167 domain-containing protein [Dehalococcoidales bacterium]|nr:DUF167 domain-containing protein [Dehalococcoidales bacterium]
MNLYVRPGAHKNEVIGFTREVLEVRVAAPPFKGKANQELIDFLSKTLGISKSSLNIIKGLTSRHKLLAVTGLTQEEVLHRLG